MRWLVPLLQADGPLNAILAYLEEVRKEDRQHLVNQINKKSGVEFATFLDQSGKFLPVHGLQEVERDVVRQNDVSLFRNGNGTTG